MRAVGGPGNCARLAAGACVRRRAARLATLVAALGSAVPASAVSVVAADLAELSLEQLGNVLVTSVSRREEPLSRAAASIYVITRDDIRRAGATTLPQALRLAPNLDVARADANQYAISARGFNNVLANKMLVLIDGRIVYTPLFSGVFWEAQDVLMEDVDRIEVISGPGATLWGANAVNGVISVITQRARDTQGTLLAGGAGNREANGAARYGGTLGPDGHYRIYAKYADRDHTELATGLPVRDDSRHAQAGFRADWARLGRSLTVQGDTYLGNIDQAPAARRISGSNVLARYEHDLGNDRALTVQAYYDATRRHHPESFHEELDTADIEAQYAMRLEARHRLLVGAGYRYSRDRVQNSASQAFVPVDRNLRWAQAFAQDDIALGPDVELTVGAKVETNVYTGADFLPNIRLAWRLGGNRLAWGALSRAVRAPSRLDRELFVPGREPHFLLAGGPDFQSEVSDVAEIGYRGAPLPGLTYSVTAFHHRYDRLRSVEPVAGSAVFGNGIDGRVSGVEGWAAYQVAPWWRVTAGGVAMRERLRATPGSGDTGAGIAALGNDPSAWWTLRSQWTFSPGYEFDVGVRHVGPRPTPAVPAYTAVDARLGWNATRTLQVSLLLQNLTDPHHPEWGAAPNRAELERGIYLAFVWRL